MSLAAAYAPGRSRFRLAWGRMLCLAAFFAFVAFAVSLNAPLALFVDPASAFFVATLTALLTYISFGGRAMCIAAASVISNASTPQDALTAAKVLRSAAAYALTSGVVLTLIGAIIICQYTDYSALWVSLAVLLIAPLYAVLFAGVLFGLSLAATNAPKSDAARD